MARLKNRVRASCIEAMRERKMQTLLNSSALDKIWTALHKHATVYADSKMLDYQMFHRACMELDPKYRCYFSAQTFLQLPVNEQGQVEAKHIFNFMSHVGHLQQMRVTLSLYDHNNTGYLSEEDLETFIAELLETFPGLADLDDDFEKFYLIIAVQKFLFFLGTPRGIAIKDIISSPILSELYSLKNATPEQEENNWFSLAHAKEIYMTFLDLDKDEDGLLSPKELEKYGYPHQVLTQTFIDRVFDVTETEGGYFDFRLFLDFVLAMDDKQHPRSLKYFFQILDVHGKGYLDAFALNVFYRDIATSMQDEGEGAVPFEDFQVEVYDLVQPAHGSGRITLRDLIKSGSGQTVVSILTDLMAFWSYEQRDSGNQNDAEEGKDI